MEAQSKVKAITELRSGLPTGHAVTQLLICCVPCHINLVNFYPRDLSPRMFGFNIFAIEVEILSFLVKVKTLNPLKIFYPTNSVISL